MGKRKRSGRSQVAQPAKGQPAKNKPAGNSAPAKAPWWRSAIKQAGKKTLLLAGVVVTAAVTTAVTAFTGANFWPWYHAATGQAPLAAQAVEQWSVGDPTERVIPPGDGSALKKVLAAGSTPAAQDAGIAVGVLKAHLVVQAEDTTVTITKMTLVVRHVKPIADGTLISTPTQGGGNAIQLYFDGDSPDAAGLDADGQDYFADSYVTLQPGEATEFALKVTAKTYYSQFWVDITIFVDGHYSTVQVGDGGQKQPFEIAPPATYGAVYTVPLTSPNRAWVREDPQVFCRQNPGICTG
jgi:hypothetical protein